MAKLLRLRRGTTTQHGSFTGAEGEVTVDTDKDTLVVHDNSTAGGRPLLREDLNNMPASGVTAGTYGSSSAIPAITVDAKGRVTSATTSAIDSTSISNGTSNVSVAASGNVTVTRGGSTVGTFQSDGLGFSDGFKAKFGDSNDLEIYHNGSDSVIADTGTGQLQIRTNQLRINNATNTENLIACDQDGNVQIYNDGALKFATTSTGIDVTGTVTCDGLTSDGDVQIRSGTGECSIKDTNNTGAAAQATLRFKQSDNVDLGYIGYTSNGDSVYSILNRENAEIRFGTNNTWRMLMTAAGHFRPYTDNVSDLGDAGSQWRNGYFNGTVFCDEFVCDGAALIAAGTGELRLRDNDDSGNNTSVYSTSVVRGQDSAGTNKWHVGDVSSSNPNLEVYNSQAGAIIFGSNNTDRCMVNSAGHLQPSANNTYDLGTSAERWRNIYTNDLNLSNEGGTNDVDGSWGSWTIQEGEDDLFLLNRRNGKKYKFNLSEVN